MAKSAEEKPVVAMTFRPELCDMSDRNDKNKDRNVKPNRKGLREKSLLRKMVGTQVVSPI